MSSMLLVQPTLAEQQLPRRRRARQLCEGLRTLRVPRQSQSLHLRRTQALASDQRLGQLLPGIHRQPLVLHIQGRDRCVLGQALEQQAGLIAERRIAQRQRAQGLVRSQHLGESSAAVVAQRVPAGEQLVAHRVVLKAVADLQDVRRIELFWRHQTECHQVRIVGPELICKTRRCGLALEPTARLRAIGLRRQLKVRFLPDRAVCGRRRRIASHRLRRRRVGAGDGLVWYRRCC
mmetsp:Transcript_162139/g.515084  ORF Transcript_162139/g.515084 Transcript_162139/m.515084 type:complete len:234 (-) Transcript_162139:432-1133(-)